MDIKTFAETKPKPSYKKVEYIKLDPGDHIIRVLQVPEYRELHVINMVSVECLGDECPLCNNNRMLWAKLGKDAKSNPAYNTRQSRSFVNVLDLTPVKICPACGREVKKHGRNFPSACPEPTCGEILTKVSEAPLSKVKIYSMGKTVNDQLVEINRGVKENEVPVGLENYDIVLKVAGVGTARTTLAEETKPLAKYPASVPEDALYPINNCLIHLTGDEMLVFQQGKVNLKDIFASRKVTTSVKETEEDVNSEELQEELNKLFTTE